MVGRTILQYKIVEKLGEGGMGVVYKAEDTQLRRTVALKFLPRETLDEEEVKARLLREAQAAASLDHPNICQVFGIHEEDGETFIAMAYIDGPSLAEKIKERPLPLDKALAMATQVAEGLHEAHEQGVVHRDIKPQNILLTAKGQVKILDFGLAYLKGYSKLTKTGTTLGTPAYMSPEQLEGRSVDRRADVWALGCVLYEMLTQKTPFEADYEQAIGYGILNEDPEPVTAQRAGLSPEVDRLLSKALAKAPAERYQHADDMLADLRVLQKQSSGARKTSSGRSVIAATTGQVSGAIDTLPPDSVVVRRSSQRLLQALLAVATLAFLGLLAIHFMSAPPAPEKPVTRFSITPEGFRQADYSRGDSISPDGQYILYSVETDGESHLWLRSLSNESARELPGTAGATQGFWSPDSLSIGFGAGTTVKRISINGGSPITLCELPRVLFRFFMGGTWSPDGERIVFASGFLLYEIAARGGQPQLLFDPGDRPRGNSLYPHFLPTDGGPPALVYTELATRSDLWLVVLNLETGERRELGPGSRPFYSLDGYLIHGPGNGGERGLWAWPFSLKTLEPTGDAFPISTGGLTATVSRDGTLAYLDDDTRIAFRTFVWRNRAGELLETVGQPQRFMEDPSLSPDGQRIAVASREGGNPDIWVHDLIRSTKTRLTLEEGDEGSPIWSPSGREIAYWRLEANTRRIMSRAADGTGKAVVLVESETEVFSRDWSRDGRYLFYVDMVGSGPETGQDIRYLDLQTDGDASEPVTFLSTPANENAGRLSPDGRYLAYQSGESGRQEIYVRPFPDGAGQWPVSVNGGKQPRWRSDGNELYYVEGTTLMAVSVSTEQGFTPGQPQVLFESPDLAPDGIGAYDVTADGQRFVMIAPFEGDGAAPPKIRIVQNWYEEFRDREQD